MKIAGPQTLSLFCLLLTAPEGVARGPDALTLLEYPETRNQFIDELMEVRSPVEPSPGDIPPAPT